MEAFTIWIDSVILAILTIVYIFRETGTKKSIRNLRTTIVSQKSSIESLEKALKIFDPDKFLSMQKVYDDFNEKKIRLETAKRFNKLNTLAETKMSKEFEVIYNESMSFIIAYLSNLNDDERISFVNIMFPNSKGYVNELYTKFGTKQQSKEETSPPPGHSA